MTCTHTRVKVWKRKRGWTRKCLECGLRQHYETKPTVFREFLPGLKRLHPDGSITVDLIDVTTVDHEVAGPWFSGRPE